MPKLTDTQLVILSAAAQRDGGAALPLPKSVKLQGGPVNHVLKSLLNKGLLSGQPAGHEGAAWRESKDGERLMLAITAAGRAAIGAEEDAQIKPQPTPPTAATTKRSRDHGRSAAGSKRSTGSKAKPKATVSRSSTRSGTKQALLVDLLRRKQGASITEVVKATGWQPHSVRGAISGTVKKKLGLAVSSGKVEGRGRVYRIAAKR